MDSKDNTKGSISPFTVYSVNEAAEVLQVNKKTIYQLQQNNQLPKKKIGKGFKFLGEDLLKCMGSVSFSEKK